MFFRASIRYRPALLLLAGFLNVVGQQARGPSFALGAVTLRPSGFFESITLHRTATTPDSVSTRFGAIPLEPGAGQWRYSPGHSRTALEADVHAAGRWLGYYESDFLNAPGRSPYRLRQLWGQYEHGSWRILAGQAWSLLRPNRVGISSQGDLMNTLAVEPAYHVGLAGGRNRQVRITHTRGAWSVALSYEHHHGGNLAAKLAKDSEAGHYEAVLVGGPGRWGAGLAAVVRLRPALSWVSQQIWTQGLGLELVGSLPAGVHAHSTLQGLEAKLGPRWQLFAYGGLAYGSRSGGNRLLRQWSVGFHRLVYEHGRWGSGYVSFQYAQLDRSTWAGGHGEMNYWMVSFRHWLRAAR